MENVVALEAEHVNAPGSKPRTVTADEELEALGFGRFQLIALAILGFANASDAVEISCLSFVLPQLPADEVSDEAKSFLSASIFLGMLAGGLVFGGASDFYGRKGMLVASLLTNATCGLLSAFMPSIPALMVMRVLAGFGVGGSVPGVFTLAAEILPVASRGFWLSTVAWWWMVGSMYSAGFAWLMIGTYGINWRYFAAVCAFPAFAAAILIILLLPESPRYLALSGRTAAAERALLRIAAYNRAESRLRKGYALAAQPVRIAGGAAAGGGAGGAAEEDKESGSLLTKAGGAAPTALAPSALCCCCCSSRRRVQCAAGARPMRSFFAPHLLRTSGLLMSVWFLLSFGYYGLSLWLPTLFHESDVDLNEYQDSFLVAAANIPGNIVSSLLMDRIGRRWVLAASLFLACVCAAVFPLAKTEATVVLASCAVNALSTASWNALDCLSTESFPTGLRTTAMGLLAATGRIGSIVGLFVFGSLVHVSVTALLSTAAAMLGCGALAALLLKRDPKGQHLVDSNGDGDGDSEVATPRSDHSSSSEEEEALGGGGGSRAATSEEDTAERGLGASK